jgi:hypothetical protein
VAWRSVRIQLALLCALFATQACVLIGYDPLARHEDPGGSVGAPTSAAAGRVAGGGGDAGATWAGAADGSARTDAGALADGAAPGSVLADAQRPGADGAIDGDAATADAAGACPGPPNACGGCEPLVDHVGGACGVCGLGHFVCASPDSVVCEGGSARPVASGDDPVIDDLEDGDRLIANTDGRNGAWYVADDGTGGYLLPSATADFAPESGGAAGSAYAARMRGGGFTDWGTALAVSLNDHQCSYDASAQDGLRFVARGAGSVQLSVATRRTVPPANGGVCIGNCFDHFNATIELTNAWAPYVIPWNALAQGGWGTPAFFSPAELMYVEFAFGPNVPFDIAVDDLAFF